jgi:hypothetical protein
MAREKFLKRRKDKEKKKAFLGSPTSRRVKEKRRNSIFKCNTKKKYQYILTKISPIVLIMFLE